MTQQNSRNENITVGYDFATEPLSTQDKGLPDDVVILLSVLSGFVCLLLIAVALVVCHRYVCDKCHEWCSFCASCLRPGRTCDFEHQLYDADAVWNDGILWTAGPPIINGNFIPHTPVMWTPPTYDDLMTRDAAVADAQSKPKSPPPSYCSGSIRELDISTTRSSQAPVSVAQSQSSTVTAASSQTTVTTSTTGANCTTSTTTPAATRIPQVQESFQSLDNIDLAIFGSTAVLADPSTAVSTATARVGPEGPPTSRSGGVVMDAAALFTGSRAPITRLATPRFRSRTNRGNFFDPTRLLRVDEGTKPERSAVFTQL